MDADVELPLGDHPPQMPRYRPKMVIRIVAVPDQQQRSATANSRNTSITDSPW